MVATTINTNPQYLIPPAGITIGSVNGRTYTYIGNPVQVPWFDVVGLVSNGWTVTSAPIAALNLATVPIAAIGDSIIGNGTSMGSYVCTLANNSFGNGSLINNSVVSITPPNVGPTIVPWGNLTQTQLTPTNYGTYNSTTGVIPLTFSVQLPGMSVGTSCHFSGFTTSGYNGYSTCTSVPTSAPWVYGFNVGSGQSVVTQTAGYLDGSGQHGNSDSSCSFNSEGVAYWAACFTNQNVRPNFGTQPNAAGTGCVPCSIFGWPGMTTDTILTYGVPKVLAMNPLPSACIVLCGTNNLAQVDGSQTFSFISSTLLQIYTTLINAGIRVVAVPIPPRSDMTFYNPSGTLPIQISSITWTGGVATVTTTSAHGLSLSATYNGWIVNAKASTGVQLTGLNGQFIFTPTSTTTFTYPLATYAVGTAAASAGFGITNNTATPGIIGGLTYAQLNQAAVTRRQVNDWMSNLDQTYSGLYVADCNAYLEDANSILMDVVHNGTDGTNTNLATLFRQDYLHPSNGGAMVIGYSIAQTLLTLLPQKCDFLAKNNVQYSNSGVLAGIGATSDNLVANSLFTLTAAATPVGTDVTWTAGTTGFNSGQLPTGWTLAGSSLGGGSAITCTYGMSNSTLNPKFSNARNASGAQMVQLVIGGTYNKPANSSIINPNLGSAPFIRMYNGGINIANAGLSAGVSVEGYVYIEVSIINPITVTALSGNCILGATPVYFQLYGASSSVFSAACFPGLNPYGTFPQGQTTLGYTLCIPPYMINPADVASGTMALRIYIYMDSAGTLAAPTAPCQAVIRIGAPTFKVAQPGYVV